MRQQEEHGGRHIRRFESHRWLRRAWRHLQLAVDDAGGDVAQFDPGARLRQGHFLRQPLQPIHAHRHRSPQPRGILTILGHAMLLETVPDHLDVIWMTACLPDRCQWRGRWVHCMCTLAAHALRWSSQFFIHQDKQIDMSSNNSPASSISCVLHALKDAQASANSRTEEQGSTFRFYEIQICPYLKRQVHCVVVKELRVLIQGHVLVLCKVMPRVYPAPCIPKNLQISFKAATAIVWSLPLARIRLLSWSREDNWRHIWRHVHPSV